jgi:hypothetical protein
MGYMLESRQPVTTREEEDNVEIRYQATTGEDTADWEDLACAVVNCKVRTLVRLL